MRRRAAAWIVATSLAFAALGARLVQLQVVGPERLEAFGEAQLVERVTIPASRGSIFDRNGDELALSIPQTTIYANPRLVDDPAGHAAELAPLLGADPAELQRRLSKDAAFVYVGRKVSDEVADAVKKLDLPGVGFLEEPKRFNPAGDLARPVLGIVGTDAIGLGGLEVQFEEILAGQPGERVSERAPGGTLLPDGLRSYTTPQSGTDLVLTIDRALQYETERLLAERVRSTSSLGGIALVMDSQTGDLLAAANLVTDPETGEVKQAPSNQAVTRVFEPGSVNKLITIAAALEEDLVRPESTLLVPSSIRVADHTFSEHDPHPTEDWSITEIMANSSNVGTIMLGQRLGKERIDSYLRRFGFGEKTALEFPGESRGLMLDPDKWSGTSIGTIPIGQGIAVTAVQMLAAYNTIANGGEYVSPKLVKATIGADGAVDPTPASPRRRVVSAETAAEVTAMLAEVVRVGTGTEAQVGGYRVAGKTGTARKPLDGRRGYKAGAYVSSFAGFVPAERPRLTSLVMLDEPTPIYAGLTAAPLFGQLNRYGLRHLRIPPVRDDTLPDIVLESDVASTPTGEVAGVATGADPAAG